MHENPCTNPGDKQITHNTGPPKEDLNQDENKNNTCKHDEKKMSKR